MNLIPNHFKIKQKIKSVRHLYYQYLKNKYSHSYNYELIQLSKASFSLFALAIRRDMITYS